MGMPSPYEIGRDIGNNISGAFKNKRDLNALDQILEHAGNSDTPDHIIGQLLARVAPERQELALNIIKNQQAKRKELKEREAYEKVGVDPNLPDAARLVQLKAQGDQELWKGAIDQRNKNLGQNQSVPQENAAQDQENNPSDQQAELNAQEQDQAVPNIQGNANGQTPQNKSKIKPVYASTNVDPKFFKKDISKYETTRLAEANRGFQKNEKYMTTAEEQASTQPFIQNAIRSAINDVKSGNVSGALSALRAKLGKIMPSILTAEEKNFSNAMKTVALEEFAGTPGFRSQGEFFILQQVLPNLGDRKKSQEMNLKAILDASLMKSKQEEVILDIINQSPEREVPLNLQAMVKERMDEEWKKLYARRYAEDPKIWDEYIKSNPNDPLFKDIKNVPVPSTSIDWNNYVKMTNKEGKKTAVHKSQVQEKLKEGYKELK